MLTPPPQTEHTFNNQMAGIPESGTEPESFVSEESVRGESLSSSLILTHSLSLSLNIQSFGVTLCRHLAVANFIWIYLASVLEQKVFVWWRKTDYCKTKQRTYANKKCGAIRGIGVSCCVQSHGFLEYEFNVMRPCQLCKLRD